MIAYPEHIALANAIIRSLAFVILYVITGFGPGFMIGILLGNRVGGHNKPVLYKVHAKNIAKAMEHNDQWLPDAERWKRK